MLRVDPTLNHIPARREHVVSLYESINQPLVNIPNHGTAATGAYLLGTRNEHGYYTVFVYLHQPDTRAVIIYVSEPRSLTADQFRLEEAEAVRFVESMGFLVDSVHFRQLSPVDQDAVMGRVPIFRPPSQTMDLYDVAEDQPAGDPIFGGLAPSTGDLFRRAGLGAPSTPPGPAGFAPGTPSVPPGAVVPPGPAAPFGGGLGGSTPPGWGGNPRGLPSTPPKPSPVPPPSAFSIPPGFVQAPAPSVSASGLAPFAPPVRPPDPPPPERRPDPQGAQEALQRLGRLLGAFGLLLACAAGGACRAGGAEAGGTERADTQIDLGNQHLAEGKYAEAISAFQLALEESPKEKHALRGTALAYMYLERPAEAERLYREVIELDPAWSEPKNELARLMISTRRCDEAERLLREVKGDIFYATPEFADNNLALALECLGRAGEGISLLDDTLAKKPLFCQGYITLSQLSAQAKKPEVTVRACEGFEIHCAANEHLKDQISPILRGLCYLRSGLAHAEMGDVESARSSLLRCRSTSGPVGKECQQSLELLPQ